MSFLKKHGLKIIAVVVALLLVGLIGFVVWASTPQGVLMPEVADAMTSGAGGVTVTLDPWITFTPDETPQVGLIYYPGGRVEAESYSPFVRRFAEEGVLGVIPPMPLMLAVFDADAATRVMDAHPEIEHWVLAGHSLGGAMAGSYAQANDDRLDGMVFLGAYAPAGVDLSNSDLEVISIWGSEDLTLSSNPRTLTDVLPPTVELIEIQGGNHAYFGWYGPQAGDGVATITREEQQDIAFDAIMSLIRRISADRMPDAPDTTEAEAEATETPE
jgi:dienelactone hydrolase